MRDSLEVIGSFLVETLNQSMRCGVFPKNLKIARVTPIPKIPHARVFDEFRPINCLPKYEQLMEVVVKDQIVKYIHSNNILVPQQSGFRSNFSCESNKLRDTQLERKSG
jgi:hypothetical protein